MKQFQSRVCGDYRFKPFEFTKIKTTGRQRHELHGHRICCDDTNLYSFGGHDPQEGMVVFTCSPHCEVLKLNLATKVWDSLDVKCKHCCSCSRSHLQGTSLMAYGTHESSGDRVCSSYNNTLSICPLNAKKLIFTRTQTTGDPPQPGYGQACCFNDNKLYVSGGAYGDGRDTWCDVHYLDMNTFAWHTLYTRTGLYNEPEGRFGHAISVTPGKIYILGGCARNKLFAYTRVHIYVIDEGKWLEVQTVPDPTLTNGFPKPRRHHSFVSFGTNVYIMGGIDRTSMNGDWIGLQDVWGIDLTNFTWTCYRSLTLPNPIFFHDSCVTPSGKLLVYGGWQKKRMRTAEIHSAWVCIPALKEMAWEAILYYKFHQMPNFLEYIPPEFRLRISS